MVISMMDEPQQPDQHEEDTDDTTSLEESAGGVKSRLMVVVPAILSRQWTKFSDKTNRNLNALYGNSVRVQLQTNLQFIVHSLQPNTFSKRLAMVLVGIFTLIGAATAPFLFWSVAVYSFGVAMVISLYLLISRECSKSPLQKQTFAKEKIRQLCSKLNEKHSHKVLVVFTGTDLCFFSTKIPVEDATSKLVEANREEDVELGLQLEASLQDEEAAVEVEPKDIERQDTIPFVASFSPSKFESYESATPQHASVNAIFRWKQKDHPNGATLPSSSTASKGAEQAQPDDDDIIVPSKQLLIAHGIEEDQLEFVSAGMLTPWVLPMAPSHVIEPDMRIDETNDLVIRALETDDETSQPNDRHSILQTWRKSIVAERT